MRWEGKGAVWAEVGGGWQYSIFLPGVVEDMLLYCFVLILLSRYRPSAVFLFVLYFKKRKQNNKTSGKITTTIIINGKGKEELNFTV